MPTCAKCEPDELWPTACRNCGKNIAATAARPLIAQSTITPIAAGCLRIVLIGHGTHSDSDGDFIIPGNITVFFKVAHGSNAMGGDNTVAYCPTYTLRSGERCPDYRLWPMVGEDHTAGDQWCPYHHAHRDGHLQKLIPGATVFMYSARSGDGPRLSSIIARVRLLAPAAALEFIWLACREQGVDKYTVQQQMRFEDGAAPIG